MVEVCLVGRGYRVGGLGAATWCRSLPREGGGGDRVGGLGGADSGRGGRGLG